MKNFMINGYVYIFYNEKIIKLLLIILIVLSALQKYQPAVKKYWLSNVSNKIKRQIIKFYKLIYLIILIIMSGRKMG